MAMSESVSGNAHVAGEDHDGAGVSDSGHGAREPVGAARSRHQSSDINGPDLVAAGQKPHAVARAGTV